MEGLFTKPGRLGRGHSNIHSDGMSETTTSDSDQTHSPGDHNRKRSHRVISWPTNAWTTPGTLRRSVGVDQDMSLKVWLLWV